MQDDCGRWQFSCRSGDCIAIYDVCNGIPQCRDGSDEDAAACKPTAAPPTQHPHLRYHALSRLQYLRVTQRYTEITHDPLLFSDAQGIF